MADDKPRTGLEAFSYFREKMSRFVASGAELPRKEKNPLQRRIIENDEAHEEKILRSYEVYRSPNENETSSDEANLLAAFSLFKGIKELNDNLLKNNPSLPRTECPAVKEIRITTGLAKKERYKSGEDLYFLRTWFYFEEGEKDFVPVVENGFLTFAEREDFSFSPEEKEILRIIKNNFYQGRE